MKNLKIILILVFLHIALFQHVAPKKHAGLRNIGNTCFLDSQLHALAQALDDDAFTKSLQNATTNSPNVDQVTQDLLIFLQKLAISNPLNEQEQNTFEAEIKHTQINNALRMIAFGVADMSTQDTAELLSTAVNGKLTKGMVGLSQSSIADLFRIHNNFIKQCATPACQGNSKHEEPAFLYSPRVATQPTKLQDLMFTSMNKKCGYCKTYMQIFNQFSDPLPPILIITKKIEMLANAINISANTNNCYLELGSLKINNTDYELIAAVLQLQGHVYTFAKAGSDSWVKYDYGSVIDVKNEDINQFLKDGYLNIPSNNWKLSDQKHFPRTLYYRKKNVTQQSSQKPQRTSQAPSLIQPIPTTPPQTTQPLAVKQQKQPTPYEHNNILAPLKALTYSIDQSIAINPDKNLPGDNTLTKYAARIQKIIAYLCNKTATSTTQIFPGFASEFKKKLSVLDSTQDYLNAILLGRKSIVSDLKTPNEYAKAPQVIFYGLDITQLGNAFKTHMLTRTCTKSDCKKTTLNQDILFLNVDTTQSELESITSLAEKTLLQCQYCKTQNPSSQVVAQLAPIIILFLHGTEDINDLRKLTIKKEFTPYDSNQEYNLISALVSESEKQDTVVIVEKTDDDYSVYKDFCETLESKKIELDISTGDNPQHFLDYGKYYVNYGEDNKIAIRPHVLIYRHTNPAQLIEENKKRSVIPQSPVQTLLSLIKLKINYLTSIIKGK